MASWGFVFRRVRSKRGACANTLAQRVETVDAAFLAALEAEALRPERFRYAVRCGVARLQAELGKEPDRGPALAQEKASLTRKIRRLVEAIGEGQGPAALVEEIRRAEARVQEIEAELARRQAAPVLGTLDLTQLEQEVGEQLGRFAALLRGNIPRARQALKKLLVDRVDFSPVDSGTGRKTYRFRGELNYGAVLQGSGIYAGCPQRDTPGSGSGAGFYHSGHGPRGEGASPGTVCDRTRRGGRLPRNGTRMRR